MDKLDKLIRDVGKLNASARVGALDQRSATLLQYAEFGTRTAPPRPVLSATTDASENAIQKVIARELRAVLGGKSETGEAVLKGAGEALLQQVGEAISRGFGEDLAESTLEGRRRRGNSDDTPLADPSLLEGGEKTLASSLAVETKPGSSGWSDD